MKPGAVSLVAWQQRFGMEKDCAAALMKLRRPNGFYYPKCGYALGFWLRHT